MQDDPSNVCKFMQVSYWRQGGSANKSCLLAVLFMSTSGSTVLFFILCQHPGKSCKSYSETGQNINGNSNRTFTNHKPGLVGNFRSSTDKSPISGNTSISEKQMAYQHLLNYSQRYRMVCKAGIIRR